MEDKRTLRELNETELDHVTGGDSQPQSGQPGLTEGQNGPPPYPSTDGGGQPQSGQPGLTEGQNGPPPYP
jgi:bacteriocin-like protein